MCPPDSSLSNDSDVSSARIPSTDTYIPTPHADGTCNPHIKESSAEGWYWVVCEDCSTELVEGEANALARLEECDGTSDA